MQRDHPFSKYRKYSKKQPFWDEKWNKVFIDQLKFVEDSL